jgi:hypothetical protein
MVLLVFVQTHQLSTLAEMFFHYSHNSFLHFFFQNMVFTSSIDIVQEFLSAVVVFFLLNTFRKRLLSLSLQIFVEGSIVLTGERLDSNSHLFFEVISRVLREGPADQGFNGHNFIGLGLWLIRSGWGNGLVQL